MYTQAKPASRKSALVIPHPDVRFRDKQVPETTNPRTILASHLPLSALLSGDKRSPSVGLRYAQMVVE